MKKILLSISFLTALTTSIFAQSEIDSIEVLIDTINIRGYVFDQSNKPFAGVKVSTDTTEIKTNLNGFFELKGIRSNSPIHFRTDSLSDILFNNTSRFIIYRLVNSTNHLATYDNNIKIEAKRTQEKNKVLLKDGKLEYPGFVNYQNPATYPGGMTKFYKYIQDNLRYPKKAIDNNMEGIVGIEFDVTIEGRLANFKIIKDIDYDCSAALIEVLKKSRSWNPGMTAGRPITKKFYIEIPFKLTD